MAAVVLLLIVGLLCLGGAAGFVVLIVVLVQRGQRQRAERTAGMAGYAASREWSFAPDGTGLERRFDGSPFGLGSARTVRNVVEGVYESRPFVAFDYTYRTSSGSGEDRHSTTHAFSVIAMHLGVTSPMLAVAPQGSLGRFFNRLFQVDVLVGDRVFDDAFVVRADSVEFARDVLHPALTSWLTAYQDRAWRLQGDQLLMFRSGAHSPAEVDAVLASMTTILSLVPGQVWERLGR